MSVCTRIAFQCAISIADNTTVSTTINIRHYFIRKAAYYVEEQIQYCLEQDEKYLKNMTFEIQNHRK